MTIPARHVVCDCGHEYESALKVNWCPKCGNRIFESDKEKRAGRLNTIYIYTVIIVCTGALAYFFFELIVIPILTIGG